MRRDVNGKPYGLQIVAAPAEGAWVDYVFENPETGELQRKNTWVVRRDGLVFGSGWYEPGTTVDDPAAFTKTFVQQALDLYDAIGREAAVAFYNTPESVHGQWYVFISDADDVSIAHATVPANVGRRADDIVGPNAFPAGRLVADGAADDGAWVRYTYVNPATGAVESKHSWVVRYDGLVFGSGWYEPGPAKEDAPAYTRALVDQAIHLAEVSGRERAIAYYNLPASVDGPWYVFVIDADGAIVAQPTQPELVGTDAGALTDVNGKAFGRELAAADGDGAWVDYVFENPDTGELQRKNTWVVRSGGLIFGSGWYEPAADAGDAPAAPGAGTGLAPEAASFPVFAPLLVLLALALALAGLGLRRTARRQA